MPHIYKYHDHQTIILRTLVDTKTLVTKKTNRSNIDSVSF